MFCMLVQTFKVPVMVSIRYHVVAIPFASYEEKRELGMKVIQNAKMVAMMVISSSGSKKTQHSWQNCFTVAGITSRTLNQV